MKTIEKGNHNVVRIASAFRALILILGYIGFLMISDESEIKPYIAPCVILLAYPLNRFTYQKWIIEDSYNSISYSSAFSTTDIPLENISQIVPSKKSIRIFYDDGSDNKLHLNGLPQDVVTKIKQKLKIEPAVGLYGENAQGSTSTVMRTESHP